MADYDDEDRWGGRTWTLLAALGIVLAIVAVGAWVVLRDDDDGGASGAATTPEGYVGPRAIEGGVPVGFAHSPAGSQAAAAAWLSYGVIGPPSRMAEGVSAVFASPEVYALDPEFETWLSLSPVAVSEGIGADAGVIRVLATKTQEMENGSVVVSLLSTAVSMEWSEDNEDWRVTQLELLEEFVPPLAPEDFEGFFWLAPVSYQTAGPLFSP